MSFSMNDKKGIRERLRAKHSGQHMIRICTQSSIITKSTTPVDRPCLPTPASSLRHLTAPSTSHNKCKPSSGSCREKHSSQPPSSLPPYRPAAHASCRGTPAPPSVHSAALDANYLGRRGVCRAARRRCRLSSPRRQWARRGNWTRVLGCVRVLLQ